MPGQGVRVKVGKVKDTSYYFKVSNLAPLDFVSVVLWISPFVLYQNFELLFTPKTALEIFQGIKNDLILSLRITNPSEICFSANVSRNSTFPI